MSSFGAARSVLRSAVGRTALGSRISSAAISKPASSPFCIPKANQSRLSLPTFRTPAVEMSRCVEPTLPYQTVLLTSMLSVSRRTYSGTPEVMFEREKSRYEAKAASNCSEILSYTGGLDGEQKQLIKKLVNFRMKEGKRTRVRAIVYQTFHRLAQTERDVIKLMVDAVENIKPICEVEKVGVAGTVYDVPGIVPKDRQQTLAIRWILEAAFKRRISHRISLEKCLFAEILDAYRKRGIARKKRENLHKQASTSRSFAHYRWW